ncbi:MAG: hypothetical protein A2Y15_03180 [Clostridiales bacterium GWF2_36_10]|nr:MAG: hypothetical protein A2Y15_03180 [Clostridiales bacterium GWF2_36_10]HAN20975.1 hypothetical protein [Clostridiales bacterium]
MIRMVNVKKQSVAFCKYVIAGLLWTAIVLQSVIPVFVVFGIMFVSAFTGVQNSPLVILYNITIAKYTKTTDEYINMHSMRFAHIVGSMFSGLALLGYYFIHPILSLIFTVILAILQSIAALGYCSAQKLYECVICNSNCCRFGKKVRSIKKNVR